MVDIAGLPTDCQKLADRMVGYGFTIARGERGRWDINRPAGVELRQVRPVTHATEGSLRQTLFRVMRAFEIGVDILVRFQQGAWGRSDCPWSEIRYGTRSSATTMREGGCGPTSVAIIVNYHMSRLAYRPGTMAVTPAITPAAACAYFGIDGFGRAYNGAGDRATPIGSDGGRMMQSIVKFGPGGFRGEHIGLGRAKRKLHNGDLVLFAMANAVGTTRGGAPHGYGAGGHFMVLSGHSGDGETSSFDVLDCGASTGSSIATMSETALGGATLWYITPPDAD
jgi:hypothetical protein